MALNHQASHSRADTGRSLRQSLPVVAPAPAAEASTWSEPAPVIESVSAVATVSTPADVTPPPVSRTTEWRRWRKKEDADRVEPLPPKKPRKQYTCRKCGGTSHPQFYGRRWCPATTSLSLKDWMTQQKADRDAKKAASKDDA